MTEGSLTTGRAIDLLAAADKALAATMAKLTQDNVTAPSLCEGWSRAHVLAHLARNADALQHLVLWAAMGREHPAYASAEQRNQDIEEGAQQPLSRLRADVIASSSAFASRVEVLRGRTDLQPVRIGTGPTVPGDRVPWMRLREVTYHHVDLDAGFTFADVPPEVVRTGLYEAIDRLNARPGSPHVSLLGTDNRHWHLGGGGHEVQGHPCDLLLWLTRGISHNLTSTHDLPAVPAFG